MKAKELLDELVKQIAIGQLTLAQIAGLHDADLDALYAYASRKLDAAQDAEAAAILAGLLVCDPYQARSWRAYAIALHRLGHYQRALEAYNVADVLQPDTIHLLTYRAEIHLILGQEQAARQDIEKASRLAPAMQLQGEAAQRLSFLQRLINFDMAKLQALAAQAQKEAMAQIGAAQPPSTNDKPAAIYDPGGWLGDTSASDSEQNTKIHDQVTRTNIFGSDESAQDNSACHTQTSYGSSQAPTADEPTQVSLSKGR